MLHQMAGGPSPDARQRRIIQLAQQWGLQLPPAPAPLMRPPTAPTFRTPTDDFYAEELLKRRQMQMLASQSSNSLKRAFTTKKKGWDQKEVFEALAFHIANVGSPGIAEALIQKLFEAGGDLNSAQKAKTNILTRRRSLEDFGERRKLLQMAINSGQVEMVQVLLPHADPVALDTSLPLAIRKENATIVELLLRYGANASQTVEGQDAFRVACASGKQAQLVGLVLQSQGRPSVSWCSQSMVNATEAGCLETVLQLSRSVADGNHNNAQALKAAINQGRRDIALAIVMGNSPPQRPGLDEAFTLLFDHPSISPNEKLATAELLLCAGAEGEVLGSALLRATEAEFFEMVTLLVHYGAPVEHEDAKAVRRAVANGRADVALVLLSGSSSLSSAYASECVGLIPKRIAQQERLALLDTLLRKGAAGPALSECLIDCVEDGDVEAVKLLLTPQFPEGRLVENHDLKKGPRGMVYDRHEVASIDYKGGLALQTALLKGDMPMTKLLLSAKPNDDTLSAIFPQTRNLSTADRYAAVELFLSFGGTGPWVHNAMQQALSDPAPQRDENLIALFLRYVSDANFNDGGGLLAAILQQDVQLLAALLRKNVTPQTAANVIANAAQVEDPDIRLEMIGLLLDVGAAIDTGETSKAMITVLEMAQIDMKLLRILLQQGNADINYLEGVAITLALMSPDPAVVELLLQFGKALPVTLQRGMQTLSQLPSTPAKAKKLGSVLQRTKKKDGLGAAIQPEVEALLKTPREKRVLDILKNLLAAGADVNHQNAAGLCLAIRAEDMQVVELLLGAQPSPASLSAAMPHAIGIRDRTARLTFTQMLLKAGTPATEVNRALGYSITRFSDDLALLNTLVAKADTSDGEALILAIKKENPDIVELVLRRKQQIPTRLKECLVEATKVKNRDARVSICASLLRAGASGVVVSDVLLIAAADGDIELGRVLLEHGASVEHRDGQALVEACRSGSAEVLNMLLGGRAVAKTSTLEKGFQAATEIRDLNKRAAIFQVLLDKGVGGGVVDSQLVSAVRYGEEGQELVKVLLQAGASPDYNGGEAVWTAARNAFLGGLDMMVGNVSIGGKQKKPSAGTLVRAMQAALKLSPIPRYEALRILIKAGLPVTNDLHIALNELVNEEELDPRAIHLLLHHGASPTTNACKTLLDATRRMAIGILPALLDLEVSEKQMDWIFSEAITGANIDVWYSSDGLQVVRCLLEKGARGSGPSAALEAVLQKTLPEMTPFAKEFVDTLLEHGADVNYNDGAALRLAVSMASTELINSLLQMKPTPEALSMAVPRIFDKELSEEEALELVTLFMEYSDGETRVDLTPNEGDPQPVLFKCLARYPRSARLLKALLDAGYYHDQMANCQIMVDMGEEPVTPLVWALLQPQKKVSSSVIEMLVQAGAKVNFETRLSRVTPLMLAVQTRRPDIVKMLLLEGAEVDVADVTGNTPLAMATAIGGDLSITMMSNLLAADAPVNDGSLHNAARELNLPAVQVLVQYKHDPDFPSTLHGGRSALAELCLHAADAGELTAVKEKSMEKVMAFLLERGSDVTIKSDGKPLLLLAFESADPITTTRVLLKAGLWKSINKSYNFYTQGKLVYSPTMYVSQVLPKNDFTEPLLALLRANRAEDVFYATSGVQPDGAVGLPDDIVEQERAREARRERLAAQAEEHNLSLARTKNAASVQQQIWAAQAEMEDVRRKRIQNDELAHIQARAQAEDDAFALALRRRRSEQKSELAHQNALADTRARQAKLIGAAEIEVEERKQGMLLTWEKQIGEEKLDQEKALSAVRVAEREDVERMEKEQDRRVRGRLEAQKKLVDSQTALANRLGDAGVNGRRQIGYISGELD